MAKVTKKAKNFRKAQSKTAKKSRSNGKNQAAKASKAKKANQIKFAQGVKENKKKAAAARAGSPSASAAPDADAGSDDGDADDDEKLLNDVDNVDDLLSSNIFGGDDGEDEDSSDDDDEDALNEDSDAEGSDLQAADEGDDDDEVASTRSKAKKAGAVVEKNEDAMNETFESHAADLERLKNEDPEFFKFLLENDASLLNFSGGGAGGAAGDNDDEAAGADNRGEEDDSTSNVLTAERWTLISSLANPSSPASTKAKAAKPKSFPNLRAVIGAYRSVIQTLKGGNVANAKADSGVRGLKIGGMPSKSTGSGKEHKGKVDAAKEKVSKRKQRKQQYMDQQRKGVFEIESEKVCDSVLLWTADNITEMLDYHLTLALDPAEQNRKKDVFDVTKQKRWGKLKAVARIFLCETLTYLRSSGNHAHLEALLFRLQAPKLQKYLWPFGRVRGLYLKTVAGLWSLSASQGVREAAFLFLRNACAVANGMATAKGSDVDAVGEFETILLRVVRAFTDSCKRGYSYRDVSRYRFLENCIVELLKLDERTAFRVTYAGIRQMAIILRNSKKADTSNFGAITKEKQLQNQKADGKLAKQKASKDAKVGLLYRWEIVRSFYLWAKVVCSVSSSIRKELAHPLVKVLQMSMETRFGSLNYFPYVYHCLRCLNHIGSEADVFVPVCDKLLQLLQRLTEGLDRVASGKGIGGTQQAGRGPAAEMQKHVEVDVVLRISDAQKNSMPVLEGCVRDLKFLFVETLGVISRSPGFPEISHPVTMLIKKLTKSAKNKIVRKDFAQLLQHIETSCKEGKTLRQKFTSVQDKALLEKFAVFDESAVSLAKWRKELLVEKGKQERQRVEAEMKESANVEGNKRKRPAAEGEDAEAGEVGQEQVGEVEGKSKRALKRQRQKAKKLAMEKGVENGSSKTNKKAAPGPGRDDVEAADFSSDSD